MSTTETVLRSSGVTTTIFGILNQFHSFTNLQYVTRFATTLNSKYGVLNQTAYQTPKFVPTLKYFGIGTKGFQNIDMDQGALPNAGDARCMDLYGPLPIRVVKKSELASVMPPAERRKYRMMQTKTYDGEEYALFYLKLIEFDNNVEIIKKDADGVTSVYEPDPQYWLSPQPPDRNEIGGAINTNVNRIIVRAKGKCEIRHDEIMEAVTILHEGNMDFARISEIGYYTGYDVAFNANNVDLSTLPASEVANLSEDSKTYEAAYVQLAKHHCSRGHELYTQGSYMIPTISLESECCINGN